MVLFLGPAGFYCITSQEKGKILEGTCQLYIGIPKTLSRGRGSLRLRGVFYAPSPLGSSFGINPKGTNGLVNFLGRKK